MTPRRRVDPIAEARRLRAVAAEAHSRLEALEQRRVEAIDLSAPGPSPADVEHARRLWEAAEALAVAAERLAGKVAA